MKISTINRFFNVLFGAAAMVAVALFSAYLTMRVAIHGREVEVPTLAGLTVPEAAKRANAVGLRMNIENRFYSVASPAGAVLSQSPAAKSIVRRDWTVRVTQSLGPQQVAIPNLIGQPERPATIAIRSLGLELGTVAHIPSPGPAGIVLAQTPMPSDTPAASPRISLLLSEPEAAPRNRTIAIADGADTPSTTNSVAEQPATETGIVMPSLTGLTLSAAMTRTSAAGLHIVAVEDLPAPVAAPPAASPVTAVQTQAAPKPTLPGTVVAQSPPAGQKVKAGDAVKITLGH